MWWLRFQFPIAVAVACATCPLSAAEFAPPAEGPVPFRRDRMPLEVSTMAALSHDLVKLAESSRSESPAARRAAAQMLALSIALDPGNTAARKLIDQFQAGSWKAPKDKVDTASIRNRILEALRWLRDPAAGPEGTALAACLEDVLAATDPTPTAKTGVETGAWAGWVPGLAAYQPEPVAPPQPDVESPPAAAIKLAAASVVTPVWEWTRKPGMTTSPTNGEWALVPVPLKMAASAPAGAPPQEAKEFAVLPVGGLNSADSRFPDLLLKLLKSRVPDLPKGGRITLAVPPATATVQPIKSEAPSAAGAVLTLAALSGRMPDATIIGTVDAGGDFKLPLGFWNYLRSLQQFPGGGGRLVLPAAAAAYLPAILALEDPGFFLRYEVLLAKNLDELVDYSAKDLNPPLDGVSARFQEIREKAAKQPVGPFIANPFVRRRIIEIGQEAPFHYSARMLAIQAAGERPTRVPRQVLIPEIRRAMARMNWLMVAIQPDDPTVIAQMAATYEACRTSVDKLKRYAEREDLPLLEKCDAVVAALRTLERETKSSGSNDEYPSPTANAYAALRRAYLSMGDDLEAAMGEPAGPMD